MGVSCLFKNNELCNLTQVIVVFMTTVVEVIIIFFYLLLAMLNSISAHRGIVGQQTLCKLLFLYCLFNLGLRVVSHIMRLGWSAYLKHSLGCNKLTVSCCAVICQLYVQIQA